MDENARAVMLLLRTKAKSLGLGTYLDGSTWSVRNHAGAVIVGGAFSEQQALESALRHYDSKEPDSDNETKRTKPGGGAARLDSPIEQAGLSLRQLMIVHYGLILFDLNADPDKRALAAKAVLDANLDATAPLLARWCDALAMANKDVSQQEPV
jgi:hypothetical protein